MEEVKKCFKNPGKEYRAIPFWSWNDKLISSKLISQAKDFKEKGIGGFFMHSRVGLETEYMGEEWLKCVEDVVKASKEIDIDPWLYDEDRWPSGFAGGKVAKIIGDEGRAKVLAMKILKGPHELKGDELAIYKSQIDGEKIKYLQRIENKVELLEKEVLIALYRLIAPKTEWYNGDSPPDNLNPKSVNAFIKSTHEVYYKRLKEEFGRTVKGIFTDEPNIYPYLWGGEFDVEYVLPYTDIFPQFFKERRGYDFFEIAPYVFLNGEKSIKARYDFWRTISELFVESYTKQISNWCKEHNILFTGHLLEENIFPHAILCSGSIMPHYEYLDIPGIDILTEVKYEFLTVKQASSVANQLGKNRVISETYGCTGWEFTFEGQKHVGDWQYALGVNLRCQHLFLYSLRGCRKRDYPPSFNHNPSWEYQNLIEDYFARLSYILTLGKPIREILLIHPIESSWCEFNGRDKSIPQERGEEFQNIISALLGIHYDFDLGDETIIEKYGKVDKEKKEFVIGEARYKLVILPQMLTLRKSTLFLLLEFLESGGKVILLEPLPEYIEGEESKDLERLLNHKNTVILKGRKALTENIENILLRRISIRDVVGQEAEQFLYMERVFNGKKIFFIVNNDRERGYEIDLYLHGEGRIEEWDLFTGEIKNVFSMPTEGYQHLRVKFAPADSKLYVMYPGEIGKFEKPKRIQKVLYMEPVFEIERLDPNVLTLDTCQYKIEENWSREVPIWIAQREIRKYLGMINIDHNHGIQRWKWVNTPHSKDNTKIELKLKFQVKKVPKKEILLLTENFDEIEKIFVNEIEIDKIDRGWYLDENFRKIPLKNIKEGENVIHIILTYKNSTELEDFYLLGDFAVNPKREIIEEDKSLSLGDWTLQGYPHYAGRMLYRQNINVEKQEKEEIFLSIDDFSATLIKVVINNKECGLIPWKSYKLEITDFLNNGENKIELILYGSLRNMLGPLHHRAQKIPFVSAQSFRVEKEEYTSQYVFYPYGLFSPVKLEVMY
ncbi:MULTISPECIES: glycosyl hydrolase [Dictyoglomus]|uniref:Glycoside hydrolase family 2 sugar binding n=1 Tax=Dictyoglomus turgidum (strain DSM 6724 / Z-1310) TaxID=515635 RepID=B8E1H1_DICTD|nr:MULTISPECIES: glycosyl hydrolase [Dictyoglomus]ACK41496.1 conserved hypothetical protein [Dictyoglomus turgidum DSM 6724]PNV79360.1 MAG: hypothetical protein C0196_06140 [Dictyoglomus turgidum]HBU31885.1 hypothetical protein [Dictyoglomus sp.]